MKYHKSYEIPTESHFLWLEINADSPEYDLSYRAFWPETLLANYVFLCMISMRHIAFWVAGCVVWMETWRCGAHKRRLAFWDLMGTSYIPPEPLADLLTSMALESLRWFIAPFNNLSYLLLTFLSIASNISAQQAVYFSFFNLRFLA